jgi:superfamily II DNA or RNA helicase
MSLFHSAEIFTEVDDEPVRQRSEVHSPTLPGINLQEGFRLRAGQTAFLQKLALAFQSGNMSHLGVFVPGYGKTITALASFAIARHLGIAQKLVVFVPRGNLRDQYADARELASVFRKLGAPPLSFCVADSERTFLKNLHTDIIITTYQYASGKGGNEALKRFCLGAACMFVFDEVHHLSEDGSWAGSITKFPFTCSVALSGTPMRSDNKSLFGVPTETRTGADGRQTQFYTPLHETLLRDAHAEGSILKRVAVHVIDYTVKLKNTDTGEIVELSLDKLSKEAAGSAEVDAFLARKKLRFHEVYLDALLRPAFERFFEKRRALEQNALEQYTTVKRQHQMLVIAMSNKHAEAMLEYVHVHFPDVRSGRIGQDVPEEERRALLADYRDGRLDVMVQVDMIGEGTDIKPISVIVKADLVRAFSKTMQQIFRGMRYYDHFSEEANVCDIYASNDADLVQILDWISSEEQIGVTLRKPRTNDEQRSRMNAPVHNELWQLTSVEHQSIETHGLTLFEGYLRPTPVVKRSSKKTPAQNILPFRGNHPLQGIVPHGLSSAELQNNDAHLNIAEREKMLRQECSALAARLSRVLESSNAADTRTMISKIHTAAIRRFTKAQEQMSVPELLKKREWLEQCIAARRIV